jgi:hypothetical protein
MRGMNDYARAVARIEAPKVVWMAIAFSLAVRILGDDPTPEQVEAFLLAEWKTLHENDIVSQRPHVYKPRHS